MHGFWKFFWKAVLGVLIYTENQKNPVSSEPGNELVTTLPTSVTTDVQFHFEITRHCARLLLPRAVAGRGIVAKPLPRSCRGAFL